MLNIFLASLSYANMSTLARNLQPKQVNGEFVLVDQDDASSQTVTEYAWISVDHFGSDSALSALPKKCSAVVGDPRVLGRGSHTAKTEIREVQLVYPSGDTSSFFPLNDVIVEYRDNVGVVSAKNGNNGSKFDSGYGITYVSLGIPIKVAEWIKKLVKEQLRGGAVTFDETSVNAEYLWLYAKIPNASKKPLVPTFLYDEVRGKKRVDFMRSLRAIHGNFTADAGLGVKLTKSEGEAFSREKTYKISLTLGTILIGSRTKISSPPLGTEFKANFAGRTSDGLVGLLSNMTIGEGNKGDTGDDEEEMTMENAA